MSFGPFAVPYTAVTMTSYVFPSTVAATAPWAVPGFKGLGFPGPFGFGAPGFKGIGGVLGFPFLGV